MKADRINEARRIAERIEVIDTLLDGKIHCATVYIDPRGVDSILTRYQQPIRLETLDEVWRLVRQDLQIERVELHDRADEIGLEL